MDAQTGLPRFNMSLELGIFLGAKFLGDAQQRKKACLVFDEKPHRYQMYLSDVSGQDISWHANDPKVLIRCVRDWLSSLSQEPFPGGRLIWDHYSTFKGELRHSAEERRQEQSELTYLDFLHHVRSFKKNYVKTLFAGGTVVAKMQAHASFEQISTKRWRMLTHSLFRKEPTDFPTYKRFTVKN